MAPFNFNLHTKKEILIQDIIKSEEKLIKVTQLISERLKQRAGLFEDKVAEIAEPKWEHVSTFTLNNDSIIFVYQPYEVGSFATGLVEVEFTLEEFNAL